MTINRVRMIVIAFSLFIVIACSTDPARAQSPGAGPPAGAGATIQSPASDLAALSARVDKLEGNIVAADLVGTYTVATSRLGLAGAIKDPLPTITIRELYSWVPLLRP